MIQHEIDESIRSDIPLEEFESLMERKHAWLKKPESKKSKSYEMVKAEYYCILNFYKHFEKLISFAVDEICAQTKEKTEALTRLHKLKAYVSERLYNKKDINHLT